LFYKSSGWLTPAKVTVKKKRYAANALTGGNLTAITILGLNASKLVPGVLKISG
jgi:hypothetical protein